MVANIKALSPLKKRLIKGLELLPDDISLCLLNGNKVPQGKDWQNRPYSKAEVSHAIVQGIELETSEGKKYHFYPQGYGLMAGYPITIDGEKRYLLVLDQDGSSAKRKIEEMSGGNIAPTVKTTSGRKDRCHRLYYVTEEYASHLHTTIIATGELGQDGKPEHVEFLWRGRQAVLPPSVHPTTGCYQYLDCSALESRAIAHAQDWIIEEMLRDTRETSQPSCELERPTTYTREARTGEKWSDEEWALSYLSALSSFRADGYDEWLTVGMALHSVGDSLLADWDNWSRGSQKYTPGCCEKKWKSFKREGKITIRTLAHMAKQDGWRSPFADGRRGGSGGSNLNNCIEEESTEPNHWNAPVSWKGEIGWLVPTEKPVTETDPETGEETPVIDEKGKPVTETVMVFFPKCNFDFQIEQELSSVDQEDGGGIVLQVKRSIDLEQKRVIIKSVDYGSAKDFEMALKKALGDGIVVNLKSDQLKSLIHVRLREYRERGGRKYRLADRIGQQEDGTWVFADKQFTKDGQPTTQEESGWVYNPQVSPTDAFASPVISDEDPSALRNLIEAQKKVAGSNFMRFLLCDGYVAACLNEQTIVKQEGFMPILNPYGDPGGGKTVGIGSALSLVWGISDKSGMCSASESYLYERLRRYGSIPSLWDDPPSKRREDKEKLDELIKRNYGKFARKVRGSDQHPHSSFIPTTNHATGDTLPATKSRGINLFFPVTGDLKFEYQPELEDAKRRATGAFRQIISIGYNRTLVREVRARLQKHLPTAHDRAAIHLAILTWYTQKVVDLAGVGIHVESWVIENLCPELNEAQTGLNSIADFVERFIAAKSTSAIGAWNFGLVRTSEQGNCLAIHMPSVWTVIESGDPPPYNRSVLERVLVEKGAMKNKPAKLDRDRDSTLAYQREIHKGRNEGEQWIPPSKPKPVNKKCLLIPERLWGDLGFLLLVPDSPPDDDGGGGQELVTSGNPEVTSSNLDEVTSCTLDKLRNSASSTDAGNLVTQKNIEEKKLVETERLDIFSSEDCVLEESEHPQNSVTRLPLSIDEPQSTENTELHPVTNQGYFEVTSGLNEVTSVIIAPSIENAPESAAVAPIEGTGAVDAFTVGEQVMVDGIPGKVARIGTKWPQAPYCVDTNIGTNWYAASDIQKLSPIPQQVQEKPREAKVGDRVHYGEFTGVLAGKAQSGWHVSWNLCPSLLKRFPAPPAVLKDGEFKLL
jgi:hypothetical protein